MRSNPQKGESMEKLVQKFLENKCTPEETEKVLKWLQTEEGEAFLETRMKEDQDLFFDSANSDVYPELDSGQLFDEIKKKKEKNRDSTRGNSPVNPRKRLHRKKRSFARNWKFLPLAAAAVFLMAAVFVFSLQNKDGGEESGISYQVIETDRGERQTIRLRDGSTVILNHDSKLYIPVNFAETNRQIALEGEAWFEVARNVTHPFIVEAGNSIVRVLGTSFSITSHPGEESTRVVVTEGIVALGARESGAVRERIIEKNQSGIFTTGQEIKLEDIQDPERFTGWKDGKLIFHNTPFGEVAKRLERWYDIECIVADSAILEESFTSVFEDELLRQVLDVIALSMNIQYEINDQTIIFKTTNQ